MCLLQLDDCTSLISYQQGSNLYQEFTVPCTTLSKKGTTSISVCVINIGVCAQWYNLVFNICTLFLIQLGTNNSTIGGHSFQIKQVPVGYKHSALQKIMNDIDQFTEGNLH